MEKSRRIRTSAKVQQRARELRQEMTPEEKILWDRLRSRRLNGEKFRRQHPLGPFIVDYYCPAFRLVVEIGGDIHDDQVNDDLERTRCLESHGFEVIRFRNSQVENDIDDVLAAILQACDPPSPNFGRRAGDEGE
jgi:very-short-patch-repair endonuclease